MGDPSPPSGSREGPLGVIHIGVKGGGSSLRRLAHHLMADTWCRARPHRRCWIARPDLRERSLSAGGDGGSVLLSRYIRDCGGGQTYRCRAVLLYTQRRLLMWKQTDKSPFRDITINYFKWS